MAPGGLRPVGALLTGGLERLADLGPAARELLLAECLGNAALVALEFGRGLDGVLAPDVRGLVTLLRCNNLALGQDKSECGFSHVGSP